MAGNRYFIDDFPRVFCLTHIDQSVLIHPILFNRRANFLA